MSATALYNIAMSPAEAYDFTRQALQAAGVVIGTQTPPVHFEFSLSRRDVETGSIEAVMPGRALIAADDGAHSVVTVVVDPASQFVLYAAALGLAALLFGSLIFASFSGLWLLLIVAAEGYLFWAIYSKWPTDALNLIRSKMLASSDVSGGTPAVQGVAVNFGTQTPAAGGIDIADQIRRLAELRDQGHLTQEEFDAKKTELLKRI